MMLLLAIFITMFELYNLRKYGVDSAINKAEMVSELVKNGLTSHMVNNNMHQRDVFLNSITRMQNVEKIWVVRSDLVTNQFGEPRATEIPRDNIDKKVLNSGKMEYQLDETSSRAILRVTIPYNAQVDGSINCIDCHNVKYGQTLGAVSLILDITDVKHIGIDLIYLILGVTLVGIFIMGLITNKLLNPYLGVLESLSESIKKASVGIFSEVPMNKNVSKEARELLTSFNLLMGKLNTTFGKIETKLRGFIGFGTHQASLNPLEESSVIITNLSYLYQFKKEIELDKTKNDIYARLAQVLKNQFECKYFSFMEIDNLKDKKELVYNQGNHNYCSLHIAVDGELCRVARTKTDVVSSEFHKICQNFMKSHYHYYCINADIGKNVSLAINFVTNTAEELEVLKDKIAFIKSYIVEAAPSIEVKLLMQALKESAFRDGLTGLYNRKFLDEHLKKLIPQIKREKKNIGVLMLDMDYFKSVNDEYGHDVGDMVLKELSIILSENVRESDLVVRYGGEEFTILLVNASSEEDILKIAEKLRSRVYENEIEIYAGMKIKKTISIGVSVFPTDSSNIDIVLKNADIALYEAKNGGRNRVVRFSEEHISKVDLF